MSMPPARTMRAIRGARGRLEGARALAALCVPAGACLLAACSTADAPAPESVERVNAPEHMDAPYVVLVSFDGFSWDLMDRHPAPAFERVAAEGVRADRMIPIFPTKTFPAHYSIATGMYAETHGLVGNRFWAPELGAYYSLSDREAVENPAFYRGEPIWVTAERQGMLAASYFFVGSEAPVGGVQPTHWYRFDPSVPNERRVDQVLAWLSLPSEERPHMIALYFEDVDGAWHDFGVDSPRTAAAVAAVDSALARLLDGLERVGRADDVYLVLVSDHGLMPAPAGDVDRLDMTLFPGVRLVDYGPNASLFVDEGGAARVPRVRDSIAELLPAAEVWAREDVPARLHYSSDPRIGDLVISAAPGRRIIPTDRPARDTHTHGWDNLTQEMGAIFLARGPGIAAGQRIPAFESVHVYPFLAHVLGLTPNPEIDGDLSVLLPILGR